MQLLDDLFDRRDPAAYFRSFALLRRPTLRCVAQGLCQRDRAFGRTVFHEDQLGRVSQSICGLARHAKTGSAC